MRRHGGSIWLACFLLVGCSSTPDTAGTGTTSSYDDVHPPGNIDIVRCASITSASDPQRTQCPSCCDTAGFPTSSFAYKSQCTCGKSPDDAGASGCADQTASADVCRACCQNASFSGQGWVGGIGDGGGGSCECLGKSDATVCSSTLTAPSPGEACTVCCLNHGYISMVYIGIGTPECRCTG